MNTLICIAGMPGAGKSLASDYLVEKGFQFVRFGQPVLDEVKRLGLPLTEKSEKKVREDLRKKHGMGAMAILITPIIKDLLKKGPVVADGMYSFTEYKEFKKEFPNFVLITLFAPPELRYERISSRISTNDPQMRNRPFSKEDARKRDYNEIENIEKGGPIAMADYTIINIKDKKHLYKQLDEVIASL